MLIYGEKKFPRLGRHGPMAAAVFQSEFLRARRPAMSDSQSSASTSAATPRWGVPYMGVPQSGWFIKGKSIEMDENWG